MKFAYFIGIDISKDSFDVCLCSEEQPDRFVHAKFANSAAGCKQLLTCGSPPDSKSTKQLWISVSLPWNTPDGIRWNYAAFCRINS